MNIRVIIAGLVLGVAAAVIIAATSDGSRSVTGHRGITTARPPIQVKVSDSAGCISALDVTTLQTDQSYGDFTYTTCIAPPAGWRPTSAGYWTESLPASAGESIVVEVSGIGGSVTCAIAGSQPNADTGDGSDSENADDNGATCMYSNEKVP